MDNSEITAEWARKEATAKLGVKVQEQLTKCLNSIKNAVEKNEMSTNVFFYLDGLTIQELSKRGFKVKKELGSSFDQRESDYHTISW